MYVYAYYVQVGEGRPCKSSSEPRPRLTCRAQFLSPLIIASPGQLTPQSWPLTLSANDQEMH